MKHALAAALSLALFPAAAPAAAETEAPAAAPCAGDVYQQFDFWLGAWSVEANGQKAGENAIVAEEGGCLIVERWRDARGGTGQSYNFYDPARQEWRQLWVSPGAVIDYAGGLDASGAMVLEGAIAYRNGRAAPFRGRWTPNGDGTVTQHFEEYDAESERWKDWFTGLYRKQAD